MNWSWSRLGPISAILLFISMTFGCGRPQQLVSITIQPDTETFGDANTPVIDDAGLNVQLRAFGNYIHPPVTKDITNRVTWTSNSPDVATVSASGLLMAKGNACGNSLITATVLTNTDGNEHSTGAIVTGTMTATVVCFKPM